MPNSSKPVLVPAANTTAFDLGTPANWPFWLMLGLFGLVWATFAQPWLTGGQTIPWDGKAHFAPQVQFMAASFARGEWPWWTPNVFAGHPQIADPQSMLFSPPFILLALIDPAPGPWAIDAVVFAMVFAGGIGVLWLTTDFGWHPAGRLVAAIAFCFGAAMAWRLQHFGQVLSLAYLPFTLLFLRRAILGRLAMVPPNPASNFGLGPANCAACDRDDMPFPRRLAWGGLAGATAAFIVLGRDQVGLLAVYLLAAYAVALLVHDGRPLSRLRASAASLCAGGLAGGSLVAIPILLTVALADASNRPAIPVADAAAGSLHPALLVTGVVPHLFGAAGEMRDYWGPPSFHWEDTGLFLAQNMGIVYIGALPCLLIIWGVVGGRLWSREIRFFTIAFVAVLIYALGWYTPVFAWMHAALPGVSFFRRPADAVFLIGALGAMLGGYMVHRVLTEATEATHGRGARAVTGGLVLAVFALALTFAVLREQLVAAVLPLLMASAWFCGAVGVLAFARWLNPIRPVAAAVVLVAFAAADLVVNNGPNGASALPREKLDMLEPDGRNETIRLLTGKVAQSRSATRRDRIEMVGLGYHWPNTPLTHDLHATLGANPVRLAHYVLATGAGDTVAEGGQRAFPPAFASYLSPMADLLGLRYIATGEPIEKIDPSLAARPLPLVARTKTAYIYENKNALPRIIFAPAAMIVDFAQILETGRWPNIDYRHTVLLPRGAASSTTSPSPARPAPQNGPIITSGMVEIERYTNTEIVLASNSPIPGWVVLADVWHPWWQVTVDGKTQPLLRANLIFRAVYVPSGRHIVRFSFHPVQGAISKLISSPPRKAD